MVYTVLTGVFILLSAFVMMRVTEGGWFFDRLVNPSVLVAVALWLITMLLALWATTYPAFTLDGAPSRIFRIVFVLLPAAGVAAVAFPELLQRWQSDEVTLHWAEGTGWILVLGPFLLALYRRIWVTA